MSKSNSNKDHFYHVIAEHKFDRMTGKLMNVIEMLTLDEQKQIATKSVIKDYIYDCRNDCDAIRDDIFHELLKDGLPTEEHIYI